MSFVGGFDEVLSDMALSDEVHNREQQERPVRCAMVGDLRIRVPAPIVPTICEHLEVLLKHCRFPYSGLLRRFEIFQVPGKYL
jgi:hypothetical protein